MVILGPPKSFRRVGFEEYFPFENALAAKLARRLITMDSLWTQVAIQKYIRPASIQDWIRNPLKRFPSTFIIWKSLVSTFDVIGDNLAW